MLSALLFAASGMYVPPPRPAPAPLPPVRMRPVERTTEVAGNRYRVVTTGEDVAISGGDSAAPRTMAVTQLYIQAARRLTGCTVEAAYWEKAVLKGTLDCSNRVLP